MRRAPAPAPAATATPSPLAGSPRPLAQPPAVPRALAESRPCPAQKEDTFLPRHLIRRRTGGSSPYRAPEPSLPCGGGGGRAAIAAAACGCCGAAGGRLTAATEGVGLRSLAAGRRRSKIKAEGLEPRRSEIKALSHIGACRNRAYTRRFS